MDMLEVFFFSSYFENHTVWLSDWIWYVRVFSFVVVAHTVSDLDYRIEHKRYDM